MDCRAVVDIPANTIGVSVVVGIVGTSVADIPDAIAISISLVSVGISGAVIANIADTVTVTISLIDIG